MAKSRLGICGAAALLATVCLHMSAANADTFNVTGTSTDGNFGGALTVDVTSGTVTSVDIAFTGFSPDFTTLFASAAGPFGSDWTITITNGTSAEAHISFTTADTPGSLVGFDGGPIDGLFVLEGSGAQIEKIDILSGDVTPTPLPAALPVFATCIGGLGLLGWRRKRKAQAAA